MKDKNYEKFYCIENQRYDKILKCVTAVKALFHIIIVIMSVSVKNSAESKDTNLDD